MLQEKVFLFNPQSLGGGSYTLEVFFQNGAKAKFFAVGDRVKDTQNREYQLASGTFPFQDGATATFTQVTADVLPTEDSDYNSTAYTPGQKDYRPALRTAGVLGTFTIHNATNYEYTGLFSPTQSAQANKAAVGDSIVDPTGKEFLITFLDSVNRFNAAIRMQEKDKIGDSPVAGDGTLYRRTTNYGFFQGTEITDSARTTIVNRDHAVIDADITSGGGGGGGGSDTNGDFSTEFHEITAGEATAKQFTLNNMPADPTEVLVDVINGGPQERDADFEITGSVFSWAGKTLDGVLIAGDRIRLVYFK